MWYGGRRKESRILKLSIGQSRRNAHHPRRVNLFDAARVKLDDRVPPYAKSPRARMSARCKRCNYRAPPIVLTGSRTPARRCASTAQGAAAGEGFLPGLLTPVAGASPQRVSHQLALTRKMLSGRAANRASRSRTKASVPNAASADRDCVHATYSTDPGRYSHRNTAFPRSDCELKSGLLIANGAAGPALSGSTVYFVTMPSLFVVAAIVPRSRPYTSVSSDRGAAYSLKS